MRHWEDYMEEKAAEIGPQEVGKDARVAAWRHVLLTVREGFSRANVPCEERA